MTVVRARWFAVLLLGFGFMASLALLRQQQRREGGKNIAPDFSVQTLDQKRVQLRELRGSVVVLNFWATWCPPCREELPSMERLYRKMRNKGMVLLAVSVDQDPAAVHSVLQEYSISFPVALDPEARIPSLYGVTGYPETFIIDTEGVIVQHFIGPQVWDSESFTRQIEALLGERRAERSSP